MPRFRVIGAFKSNGQDVDEIFHADSEEQALDFATARGFVVHQIDELPKLWRDEDDEFTYGKYLGGGVGWLLVVVGGLMVFMGVNSHESYSRDELVRLASDITGPVVTSAGVVVFALGFVIVFLAAIHHNLRIIANRLTSKKPD